MMQLTETYLASSMFKANPYPIFAQLRSQDPVHRIQVDSQHLSAGFFVTAPGNQAAWLITRYEDADAVLKDQRFVKDARAVLSPEGSDRQFPATQVQTAESLFRHIMVNSDPPDHTRLRALVNLSFTPRLVEQWRARIQAIIDELLDAVQDKGEMDLVEAFAFPLPIHIITEMLGVPATDQMKFRTWSNIAFEVANNPDILLQKREHLLEFRAYLQALIGRKRGQPSGDLLDRLIQAEAEGAKLSEDELISMVFLLLIAGHETTINLIANGVLALLQHPDQMEKLRQDPSLINTAIEEFLRYYGSVLMATRRWAREDIELGGKLIHRGDLVFVALASANRDSEAFVDADTLDITRQQNRHLAFGKGIHVCLGAPLARLEGQIAINTLLRRMPNLRLNIDSQALVWQPGWATLRLSKLPVAF